MIPALTAEEDRDLARRYYADQKREKELLGGNTSPYNSDRYGCAPPDVSNTRIEALIEITDMCVQHLPLHPKGRQTRAWSGYEGTMYICNRIEPLKQRIA